MVHSQRSQESRRSVGVEDSTNNEIVISHSSTYLERHVSVGGSIEVSVGPSSKVSLAELRTHTRVLERKLCLGLKELRLLHFLNLTTNNLGAQSATKRHYIVKIL